MGLLFCKGERVSLGLLIPQDIWTYAVSVMARHDLQYESEKQIKSGPLEGYVKIRDIHGPEKEMGVLIREIDKYVNDTEWIDGKKYYVLLNTRRKKNVRAGRKEAGARSEGGNCGKPGVDSGHGQAD